MNDRRAGRSTGVTVGSPWAIEWAPGVESMSLDALRLARSVLPLVPRSPPRFTAKVPPAGYRMRPTFPVPYISTKFFI